MPLPFRARDFDIFLSHAHKDRVFVGQIYRWLNEKAGLSVWYDDRELAGGSSLATDLQTAIGRCRGILVVATDGALQKGWVKNEYNAGMDERANEPSFRVIALRVANANVPELLRGVTWIDMPEPRLDADTALKVVKALYPGEKAPNPAAARDVFVSCSWHEQDGVSARAVCRALAAQGFRLIGDAKDKKRFGTGEDVDRIMASCGAFVSIVPFRGEERASATEKPYKYFLQEIDMAVDLKVPSIVISDPRVRRVDRHDSTWLPMETTADQCPSEVAHALERLSEDWEEPRAPPYIFCAMDLEGDAARSGSAIRHLIERVTGMQSVVGDEITEHPLEPAIMRKICGASLVLADITDDNLNTCIEAGMALSAGRRIALLARGAPRRPPFMLRALQLVTYADDVDQIGVLHRLVRPYRRRVINAEL